VKVNYLNLTDYLAIAAEVTGLDPDTLSRVTNLDLADSALHAPRAGWAGEDFYPDFVDKAAVLVVRLAKNHPPTRPRKPWSPLHPASGTRSASQRG